MDRDVSQIEINRTALESAGGAMELLDKKTTEQLQRIEWAIQKQLAWRDEMLPLLKRCFTIRKIAQLSGLSRTTIHGKSVLKEYILARGVSLASKDSDDEIERLKRELAEAKAEIQALHRRDAELVLLQSQIIELRKANEDAAAYISYEASLTSPNLSMSRNAKARGVVQFNKL